MRIEPSAHGGGRSFARRSTSRSADAGRDAPRADSLGTALDAMRPALLGLAERITRDADASADVVQRTFLKVFVRIAQFEGRAALRTWVWRICANEALQWRRERDRIERRRTAAAIHEQTHPHHETETPLEACERRQFLELALTALDGMSEADRDLFREAVAREAGSETRERAGRAESRERAQLHRARHRLRRLLREPA